MLGTLLTAPSARADTETIDLRGRPQTLHLYGSRGGQPVIVSSGDGGWIHLAPHVAEVLAERGFFVVGFNVKQYLEGFTGGHGTLRPEDVPGDFDVLCQFAARGDQRKPILIGVSEGAGLSVLAATDRRLQPVLAGVVGLGLPDVNELGWRWTDSVIYLTHHAPDEPTFSTAVIAGRMSPVPLAMIHSTHDEFVPVAEAERIFANARDPKRMWIVNAANHRFSDNLAEFDARLVEAVRWVSERAGD
jgi:fermentation-respiration switch protein FrsA (DUF1100 family)